MKVTNEELRKWEMVCNIKGDIQEVLSERGYEATFVYISGWFSTWGAQGALYRARAYEILEEITP